ncbi:hypothetical protein [Streptomyces kaniharaensis]|nr:hypothetical protein [Streptomyces kaniharaensis]
MTTEELARLYALLTILEPQTQTCVQPPASPRWGRRVTATPTPPW